MRLIAITIINRSGRLKDPRRTFARAITLSVRRICSPYRFRPTSPEGYGGLGRAALDPGRSSRRTERPALRNSARLRCPHNFAGKGLTFQ